MAVPSVESMHCLFPYFYKCDINFQGLSFSNQHYCEGTRMGEVDQNPKQTRSLIFSMSCGKTLFNPLLPLWTRCRQTISDQLYRSCSQRTLKENVTLGKTHELGDQNFFFFFFAFNRCSLGTIVLPMLRTTVACVLSNSGLVFLIPSTWPLECMTVLCKLFLFYFSYKQWVSAN